MTSSRTRVPMAIGALVLLTLLGTLGYRLIEGWRWFDCLYMTLITIATIGYSEPDGISQEGRYFTAFLIVAGVGTAGYALSAISQTVVQVELRPTLERRRLQKAIHQLRDHYIICGSGRVGTRVARDLAAEGVPFLIVERETAISERLAAEGLLVIAGDATEEDVLVHAGIKRALGLVCALASDADNVFVTLTARGLHPSLYIVARVSADTAVSKMLKAGANRIVSPIATGAHQITQALLRPSVADFIELATKTEGLDLVIEGFRIRDGSPLSGRTLQESKIRSTLNIIVISIKRSSGEMLFNPTGDTVLRPDDDVIAVGGRASVDAMAQLALPRQARAPR